VTILQLIEAKRDGRGLSSADIQAFVAGVASGKVPDYQAAALLMAIFFRGLDAEETRTLTLAMRDSGESLAFPRDTRPLVDKHSTGGVGDKVSLPLAPLLACLGFRVPMISGRGLGITGGTLDKLESIPRFLVALPASRLIGIVQRVGCAICSQTATMVPADKALYALRDVTGTVPSIPLIVASILSKKLAENLHSLLLDVKFGSAAFMREPSQARELALAMVALGNECGVKTRAMLTSMDAPLGQAAGNWLEVKESVACLEGRGPADLQTLVLESAAHLLVQAGGVPTLEAARGQALACLQSGQPRRKWNEMLAAQGADLTAFERRLTLDHTAPVVRELKANRSGFICACGARTIGEVIRDLGGGRLTKETLIDHNVGVDQLGKPGTAVTAGDILARVHAAKEADAETALVHLRDAIRQQPSHSFTKSWEQSNGIAHRIGTHRRELQMASAATRGLGAA
jgi:pyrimidine-nucleoside phosphorylase